MYEYVTLIYHKEEEFLEAFRLIGIDKHFVLPSPPSSLLLDGFNQRCGAGIKHIVTAVDRLDGVASSGREGEGEGGLALSIDRRGPHFDIAVKERDKTGGNSRSRGGLERCREGYLLPHGNGRGGSG